LSSRSHKEQGFISKILSLTNRSKDSVKRLSNVESVKVAPMIVVENVDDRQETGESLENPNITRMN
jgi:hypothetical protein